MSDKRKRDAFDVRFGKIRDDLVAFGMSVGQKVYDKVESGSLSNDAKAELQEGLLYLLSGLETLLDDAQSLYGREWQGSDDRRLITNITGHARALIGGALFVGKHMNDTEAARTLLRAEQTASARKERGKKRDERFEVARPILEAAAYKSDGKLLNPGKELDRVKQALVEKATAEKASPQTISSRTLLRYVSMVRQNRTH